MLNTAPDMDVGESEFEQGQTGLRVLWGAYG